MRTITLTHLESSRSRKERLLDGKITVISRSGLHPCEALLINNLPALKLTTDTVLIAGNRSGVTPMALTTLMPGTAFTTHLFDLHHALGTLRNLNSNDTPTTLQHDPWLELGINNTYAPSQPNTVACTASIPRLRYGAAILLATRGAQSGELLLDQLEDIHANLADGAMLLFAIEGANEPLLKQIRTLFRRLTPLYKRGTTLCATACRRNDAPPYRNFHATFAASLPQHPPRDFTSLPGVFSHRRPDNGGLALAEVAARENLAGAHIIDLGCGCGITGLLLAHANPDCSITFIDSHARALAAARINIGTEPTPHRLILSDKGITESGYDLLVANPPYYSDFRIATLFTQIAHHTLKPGGVCMQVAKSAHTLNNIQLEIFGNSSLSQRRGYGITRSVRN